MSRYSYRVKLHLHSIHFSMTVLRKIHEITKNPNFRNKSVCFMKYISVLFFTYNSSLQYHDVLRKKLNSRKWSWNRKVFCRISLNARQGFLIVVLSFKMPNKVEFYIFCAAYGSLATSILFRVTWHTDTTVVSYFGNVD